MKGRELQLFDVLQKWNAMFTSELSTNKSEICCKPNEYPTHFHDDKHHANRNTGNATVIAGLKEITQDKGGKDWFYISHSFLKRAFSSFLWSLLLCTTDSGNTSPYLTNQPISSLGLFTTHCPEKRSKEQLVHITAFPSSLVSPQTLKLKPQFRTCFYG